jgi:hypothetical protein
LRSENLDYKTFFATRNIRAVPMLEAFKTWLTRRSEEVPLSLLLGKALPMKY